MISAAPRHLQKDFWIVENQQYSRAHYRLKKASRIVNEIAGPDECDLLDLGCGPATLQQLLTPNIHYHGIDIALSGPAPYLIEADLLESPIEFRDKHFDIVLAHGLFEYIGSHHSRKFSEIAQLLNENGRFVVSYTNFGHRQPEVYRYYASAEPLRSFRQSLSEHFVIERCFPTSHNWNHSEPNRRLVMAANMRWNWNVPVVGQKLAVAYFFVCSPLTV
jgi:SAM-dependent methyltransferase